MLTIDNQIWQQEQESENATIILWPDRYGKNEIYSSGCMRVRSLQLLSREWNITFHVVHHVRPKRINLHLCNFCNWDTQFLQIEKNQLKTFDFWASTFSFGGDDM